MLANRRSLTTSISAALEQASPNNILAVFMMDLDGFKQVNDKFGHDVGDELLVAVASRLKSNLRNSDVVALDPHQVFDCAKSKFATTLVA